MRKNLLISLLVIISIVIASSVFIFRALYPSRTVFYGSLFVSDAGRSHGGFEYNASWNATLTVENGIGDLKLVLDVGLGDVLEKHEYHVTDFAKDQSKISMKIDGEPVILIWIKKDIVWNHMYDEYYIASWGSDAPPEEVRGTISPKIFPVISDFWYVELRLGMIKV